MLQRILDILMPWRKNTPRVAVVRLSGVIASGGRFGSGLSLMSVAASLEQAFALAPIKAVALVINSPGGSPTQSHLIFKRIRQLSEEKKVPVFAFIEDVGASGGYMLACAADEIFADESSIVGSIGVVSAGFGLTGLIEKLGVERRVYTSGERKGALDPFQPENPDDIAHLKTIQAEVHTHFKNLVRDRRAGKLRGEEHDLFSGAFWVGHQAQTLGLTDGVGDLKTTMQERFGKETRLLVFGGERGPFRRPIGIGSRLPSMFSFGGLADQSLATLEARALWGRFGL